MHTVHGLDRNRNKSLLCPKPRANGELSSLLDGVQWAGCGGMQTWWDADTVGCRSGGMQMQWDADEVG